MIRFSRTPMRSGKKRTESPEDSFFFLSNDEFASPVTNFGFEDIAGEKIKISGSKKQVRHFWSISEAARKANSSS